MKKAINKVTKKIKKFKLDKRTKKILSGFLVALGVFFSGIIFCQATKELYFNVIDNITREEQAQIIQVSTELDSLLKIADKIEERIANLNLGRIRISQEERKEILLAIIEYEKESSDLEKEHKDYQNDWSVQVFLYQTKKEDFFNQLQNLPIYEDAFLRSVEDVMKTDILTNNLLENLSIRHEELKEKAKSIKETAN